MNMVQDENLNFGTGPIELDEGWWSAVLADEPFMKNQEEPFETEMALQPPQLVEDQVNTSIDWGKVNKIFTKDEIIKLNVIGFNRGGVLVADGDVHGFVPASHLIDLPADLCDEEREHYLTSYLERKISLKVIECERNKERIVFSERAALAKEGQRRHLLKNLHEGDVISGIVTNVTDFGVFVDLGGLEGLIHVSELSWGRVKHPSEILNVDDDVQTLVIQVSEDQGRIALSLKRLQQNPWNVLSEKLSPGEIIEAVISCIVKYGAFARIEDGVEGLIHISSMNFPDGCKYIDEFLYEGQAVQVCVLNIDCQKRRLGLKLEKVLN